MRRQTQRYSQSDLTAVAQQTTHSKLNQAVAEYVAAGWKVFGVHSRGNNSVVCISKTFGNVGGLKSAVLYPDGHIEYSMTKRVAWSWAAVEKYAGVTQAPRIPLPVEDRTKENQQKAEAAAKLQAEFEAKMKTLSVPAGFTTEQSADAFTLKSDSIEIKFDRSGSGHTNFKVGGSWKTLDRRGVEDSFYHVSLYDGDDRTLDLNVIVQEQLAHVQESLRYYETAIAVPSLPFTVAPERLAVLKQDLQKTGRICFTPSGFGTGYEIAKKPTRNCRFGETRAKPELETFFGVTPLYVSTLDCD